MLAFIKVAFIVASASGGIRTRERVSAMTYMVDVSRDHDDWLATVTNLEGVSTWATTFALLDHNVREAIALAEDLPDGAENSLDISWIMPTAP